MRSGRLLAALAVGALALSGCAAAPESGPGGATPSPSALPSTPAQERETGLVAPARPFDGRCDNILSDAEASTILGVSSAIYVYDGLTFAPEPTVELHAGLRCQWAPVDGSFAASISIVVLPEAAASYDPPSGCEPGGPDSAYLAPRCAVEALANGTRVSGSIWMPGSTVEPASAATSSFIALFTERANASTPAPNPIPAVGAWALPVDCAAVVGAGDFSAVPGLGATSTGGHTGGTDVPFPPAETALWGGLGMPLCSVVGESVEVTFVASGGGRWMEDTVAAEGTPFTIEGYDSAYVSPGQAGLTKVDIFDGPNWLHVQVRFPKNAKPLADALFAALATTAAQ